MKNNFMRVFWLVLFTALVFGVSNVPAADFAANPATLGAIPDYPAGQVCFNQALYINKYVTFTVSGMPSGRAANDIQIKNLTFSPAHTWAGDIIATLIAPNGTTQSVVFGRIRATGTGSGGDGSDLTGPYIFDNSYSNSFWDTAQISSNNQQIPSGAYRVAEPGGQNTFEYEHDLANDFSNVANTNGTWTLRFNDVCDSDTGSVSAVTLSITHRPTTIPTSHVGDRDGDGKTDFTIVRADGASSLTESMGVTDETGKDKTGKTESQNNASPSATQVSWWTNYSSGVSYSKTFWGLNTDDFLSEDFDGDGIDDLTVFRSGAAGSPEVGFYILNSATNTYRLENFGQTGDVPNVIGDWDGDGKADVAVYRDGTAQAPQSYFYYRGSKNNPNGNVTFVPFGQDGDYAYMGDFDGDGKTDPAVQRNIGGNQAAQYLLKSSNGSAYGFVWGFSNDFVAPGDYDRDGRTDIAVVRNTDLGQGLRKWWFIYGANSSTSSLPWGLPGDIICQGDYNGDGYTDRAIWRPSDGKFYANYGIFDYHVVKWGTSGDYPVNNWNVH